uniref:Uncharacterized protein n=1 Tax=Rhizophora mucronata TaxID=61149 RepID=A0A2P2JGC5_RHIMU
MENEVDKLTSCPEHVLEIQIGISHGEITAVPMVTITRVA